MPLNDYSRTLGVLQRMMVKYTKMRKMVAIFIENPDLLPVKTRHDTMRIRDTMAKNGLDITKNTLVTYMKTLGIKKNSHIISDSHINKFHRFKQQVLDMKQQVIDEHEKAANFDVCESLSFCTIILQGQENDNELYLFYDDEG